MSPFVDDLKKLQNGLEPVRFDRVVKPKVSSKKIGVISWDDNYSQLSSWSKNRLRYHLNEKVYDFGDPARNICGTVYIQALRNTGKEHLIDKFKLLNVIGDQKVCKKLSEFAKKKGPLCDVDWRCLVDLSRLGDYLPYVKDSEFAEVVTDWVQRKPLHTWNGDEEEWYNRFRMSARKVIRSSGVTPNVDLTVDDFVNNGDLWATSGSGFEPEVDNLFVFDKEKREKYKVGKNKWATRWQMGKHETRRLLFKRRKQICKAVQKSEAAKVRAVISSDLSLYLKMAYVSKFLDSIFRNRTDSTLWMNAEQRFNLWQDMADDGTWRMPIDQDEFDKNTTMRQVKIICEELLELLKIHNCPDDVIVLMESILFAIDGGYVIIDGKKIEIRNGIMSGWRWTAMLDTLVNLTELDMGQVWVRENSQLEVELVQYNAQGDDDWLKGKTRKGLIALWLAYESFGLKVNPGKFFLDRGRDEYLRRVLDRGVVTGYPARSVASICFSNPIGIEDKIGNSRLRSTFSKWQLFANRLNGEFVEHTWLFESMLKDSKQGIKGSNRAIVLDSLYIDPIIGGIGYLGRKLEGMVFTDPVRDIDNLQVLGAGADEWTDFSSQYGVARSTSHKFIVDTLNLERRYSLPKWVKYIFTFEKGLSIDLPYGLQHGKTGTMVLGKQAYSYARRNKLPFVSTLGDLHHLYKNLPLELEYRETSIYNDINNSRLAFGRDIYLKLNRKTGISDTLARLSEDYDKVWNNFPHNILKHKPGRWVHDFVSGRLKNALSPRPGWGIDVIGYVGSRLLPSAINLFLRTNKPKFKLWESLVTKINSYVPQLLLELKVRVSE